MKRYFFISLLAFMVFPFPLVAAQVSDELFAKVNNGIESMSKDYSVLKKSIAALESTFDGAEKRTDKKFYFKDKKKVKEAAVAVLGILNKNESDIKRKDFKTFKKNLNLLIDVVSPPDSTEDEKVRGLEANRAKAQAESKAKAEAEAAQKAKAEAEEKAKAITTDGNSANVAQQRTNNTEHQQQVKGGNITPPKKVEPVVLVVAKEGERTINISGIGWTNNANSKIPIKVITIPIRSTFKNNIIKDIEVELSTMVSLNSNIPPKSTIQNRSDELDGQKNYYVIPINLEGKESDLADMKIELGQLSTHIEKEDTSYQVTIKIINKEKVELKSEIVKLIPKKKAKLDLETFEMPWKLIAGISIGLLSLLGFYFWWRNRKKTEKTNEAAVSTEAAVVSNSTAAIRSGAGYKDNAAQLMKELSKEERKELLYAYGNANKDEMKAHLNEIGIINASLSSNQEPKAASLASTAPMALVMPTGKYFSAKVMLSAGPRKREQDTDLGEDVAGVLVQDNLAAFWIMDGSSDYAIIKHSQTGRELLSSRILATTLSRMVHLYVDNGNLGKYPLKSILKSCIEATQKELQQELNQLDAQEKNLILQRIQQEGGLNIASTATLGVLDKLGNFSICKLGDDKYFISPNNVLTDKNPQSALVLMNISAATKSQASMGSDFTLQLAAIQDHWYQEHEAKGVNMVVASSDGVHSNLLRWVGAQKNLGSEAQIQMSQHQNKTYDDKTLCIIQIKDI